MYGSHWQPKPLPADADLANFRRNGLSDGFDGYSAVGGARTAPKKDGLIIQYKVVRAIVGEDYFDDCYTCGVGNPLAIEHDGRLLTTSDLTAVYNAWQIQRWAGQPERIVEIGPGYGALAAHMRRAFPLADITLVDLPDHHDVLHYYLSETVGLDGITITDQLPQDAELVIALRCLMEMPIPEIHRYMSWLQALPSLQFLYLISRYFKLGYALKLYPFDQNWMPVLSQYDPTGRRIHELMLKRLPMKSGILQATLRTLPPFVSGDEAFDLDSRTVKIPLARSTD